ncbi:transposase [Parashewanella curva]|uniref:Transposase n=1 Tax=Parashewanella curva TaxID=2338552 RepID=A0A3L8PRL8_9GAMM|nr:IS66 family insertion sequence element accessory protein TnpB [Parashewanella curva]RLV57864.1 transposase [Parashewanella curva]
MKMFCGASEIYLYRQPVDFRNAISGLSQIVESQMNLSPFSGALFLFTNKARNKLKLLYWDKTGFALWYKQLAKEKFKWPVNHTASQLELTEDELDRLLDGFSIIGHQAINCDGMHAA